MKIDAHTHISNKNIKEYNQKSRIHETNTKTIQAKYANPVEVQHRNVFTSISYYFDMFSHFWEPGTRDQAPTRRQGPGPGPPAALGPRPGSQVPQMCANMIRLCDFHMIFI